MAIDFGRKRCGIAVTDPLRIVANSLSTVRTCDLVDFVRNYAATEGLDGIIIGEPRDMRGNPSECSRFIDPVIKNIRKALPDIPVTRYDERFTSVLAHRAMIDGALGRSRRTDKGLVDRISASIILNDYLQNQQ